MEKTDCIIGTKIKERDNYNGDLPSKTGVICENSSRSPMIGVLLDGRPSNKIFLYLPEDIERN